MSEILSPAQVDEMVNSGTPPPDMFGHLLVSHRALHDAHDAALEALRFYADPKNTREFQHGSSIARREFGEWVNEDEFFTVWHPDNGDRARAALAAARKPDAAGEGE